MPQTVVKETDGWWWADESWDWHGPCSDKEEAQERQKLYTEDLNGTGPNRVTPTDWKNRIDRESPDAIHPCTTAEPWDCDCVGSCSCHWKQDPQFPIY
jgi:hypothetical protein